MEQDLVSIIMPTYNAGKFLASSIDSVLNQTYKNIELLITDDCSSDTDTHKILEQYKKKDNRVKVFYQKENHGPGTARNISIKNAKGRYIAFCDSDDRWKYDKLEKQISLMNEKKCALSYTSYIICDSMDNETGIEIALPTVSFRMMKRDNKIGCLTAIYDTKMLGQKFYMPTIRKRQDWALFLNIIKECHFAYGLTEPLAYYRLRKDSVSHNKISLIRYNLKVYEKILGFSKIKSFCYFLIFFLPAYYAKRRKRRKNSIVYKNRRSNNGL